MRTIISLILFFIASVTFSQVAVKKSSIDSGGASVTNGSTNVVYSVGEVAVQETTIGNISISEGFINKLAASQTTGLDDFAPLTGITIFPNPATDFVNIKFPDSDNYNITIFTASGKQLENINTKDADRYTINMLSYESGVYMVLVKNLTKQQYKTYKVVKK